MREGKNGGMKHKSAAKFPLFDGEWGGTNSLKEVHSRQAAAVGVPAMWGLLKILSFNNLSLYNTQLDYETSYPCAISG